MAKNSDDERRRLAEELERAKREQERLREELARKEREKEELRRKIREEQRDKGLGYGGGTDDRHK